MARELALAELVDVLASGEMDIIARLPQASNATFLVRLLHGDVEVAAVYKPRQGERPLWDFPVGTLCRREVASFVVSNALGWDLVPPTILRSGPYGVGSVQMFVRSDHASEIVIEMIETGDDALAPLALFDVVVNSADRKFGHCLRDDDGKLWAIDNGLTFHAEPKLRTVLWEWSGQPIPQERLADLERLCERVGDDDDQVSKMLATLLCDDELDALRARIDFIGHMPFYPFPDPVGPSVPWPPW